VTRAKDARFRNHLEGATTRRPVATKIRRDRVKRVKKIANPFAE